ncbi:MAG TPA: dienelactone hydrolase family protein [Vicinamibacterales bacterium]|nr:dienelactone hydrolase family protein [Vicinamibacterales bacterium]
MKPSVSHSVQIGIEGGWVDGDLVVSPGASGLVIFAHGSGSGRHSRRNRAVAESLQRAGLATLLLDLLTPAEETIDVATAEFRFDVGLLAERVIAAIDWAQRNPETSAGRIGLFGASTGAAAALIAAAARPETVGAVASRGGRPDLAGRALRAVRSPTLLIVGGADHQVIALNRLACDELGCERHLEIVPGASHLFEERGALEEVAQLAGAWFTHHLTGWERTSRSA